jgi:hypothetical protein
MWGNRARDPRDRALEARLRSARPVPRDDFVREVAADLAPRRPRVGSRLAFAAAFTTLLVGMFASFGGAGYAKSGASQAYETAKKLTTSHVVKVHSPAASQYKPDTTPEEPANNVAGNQNVQGQVGAVQAQAQTLPFTGISLLTTVLVSLAMIALGLALRRRERRES